ncbi:MAG: succinylglutamate desuccinylase/aspartoacylase family protein [Alphaproteobacteria bacterium]|nr:succinylglutamate desuccinylase/aspartoacylase family protein [Alphaproteobacteria bacterium]
MIESITFAATEPGPRFLVLGAVHGTEMCGPHAIRRVMDDLHAGRRMIAKGRVTFVPEANARAFAAGKRFIDRNLNRFLVPTPDPQLHEEKLGNILCPMLADCDYMLDIHSYTVGGPAFAIAGSLDAGELGLAASLGADATLIEMADAYERSEKSGKPVHPDESVGTTVYARRMGAKAVLLESGKNGDPATIDIAYRAILGALSHLGMTVANAASAQPQRLIRTHKVYFRTDDGVYTQEWKNFSPVTKGQHLATRANGEKLYADIDGVIVLPFFNVPLGGEWFYVGYDADVTNAG